MSKVILITGASSGIGLETAKMLIEKGHKVYGGARRIELMQEVKGLNALNLDITNEASIKECVEYILQKEKIIDVLINNAGYGLYGAIEDIPLEEAKRQFEVNLFGLAKITQLILPVMREKKEGKIINISSIGGKVYSPLGAWYYASKHALEAFSDCLRFEVKQFNIKVVIIEPGMVKTEWDKSGPVEYINKFSKESAYQNIAKKALKKIETIYSKNIPDGKIVAEGILKAIDTTNPKTRYTMGYMAKTILFLRKFLSDKAFESAF